MKKLAIVGTHPDTRANAPFDNLEYDIWVFNEAPQHDWCKRWTGCFQLHKREVYTSPNNFVDKTHWQWLQQDHGDKMIWMQEVDPLVPNSQRFPFDEMAANFPACEPIKGKTFFTSTAAMSLALALYLGYEYIETYGIDLASNTEYTYQQAGWIYWCGVAKATLGDNFVMRSGLHHFEKRTYGYEGETQIDREYFKERAVKFEAEMGRKEIEMKKWKGRLSDCILDFKPDDFNDPLIKLQEAAQAYGYASGALQEARNYSAREDPIPRQQFERRGAQAQKDVAENTSLMDKEGGKIEYVFNAWKNTRSMEAVKQLRMFIENFLKYAVTSGGNGGVMQENMGYMMEYDRRVEAAGGQRTLIALEGSNNGSN